MMENYDRTLELTEVAQNAAGKSNEQFAKYSDTVQYKLSQLSNSWEQLRQNFLKSDIYKAAIESTKNFVDFISNIDFGQVLALGAVGLTVGKSFIENLIKGIQSGTSAIIKETNNLKNRISRTLIALNVKKARIKEENVINESGGTGRYESSTLDNTKQILSELAGEQRIINTVTGEMVLDYIKANSLLDEKKISLQLLQEELNSNNSLVEEEINQKQQAIQEIKEEISAEQTLQEIRRDNLSRNNIDANDVISNGNLRRLSNTSNDEISSAASRIRDAENAAAGSKAASFTTNLISDALMGAVMSAFAGADFKTVIATSASTALMGAIPIVMEKLIPSLISVIGGPAGIAVAVAAAVTTIAVSIIKKIDEAAEERYQAEISRLRSIKELNENLQAAQEKAQSDSNSLTTNQQTLSSLKETYDSLSKKSFLTSDEQSTLNATIESLTNDYGEIISSFDENTNEITFNTSAIENLNRSLDEQIKNADNAEKLYANAQIVQTQANNEALEGNYNKVQEMLSGAYLDSSLEYDTGVLASSNASFGHGSAEESMQELIDRLELLPDEMKESVNLPNGNLSEDDVLKAFGIFSKANAVGEPVTATVNGEVVEYTQTALDTDIDTELDKVQSTLTEAFKEYEANAFDEVLLEAIRSSANISYKEYEAAGEKIGEDVAADLASGITKVDVENETKKFQMDKINTATGLTNYTQWVNGSNVTTSQLESFLSSVGFVDEKGSFDDSLMPEDFGKNYNDLPEQAKAYFESIIPNINDLNASKKNEAMKKAIEQGVASIYGDFGTLTEEELKKYENQINAYKKLQDRKGSMTEAEYQAAFNEIWDSVDGRVKDILVKANNSVNGAGQAVSAYRGNKNTLQSLGIQDSQIESLSLDEQSGILGATSDANLLSTESSSALAQTLADVYTNLKPAAAEILAQVDVLNSSYGDLIGSSQEYIRAIADTGLYSLDEATKIYNDYINTITDYLSKPVYGQEGADLLSDQLGEQTKGLKENYSDLIDAQKEYQENGIISSETYYKLQEAGMDSYVKRTSKGYELMAGEAEKAWVDAALVPVKTIDKAIEEQRKGIEKTKKLVNEVFTGEYLQGSMLVPKEYSFDELLGMDANSDTFLKLKDEYPALYEEIRKAQDAGAVSAANWAEMQQEGLSGLLKNRPDDYIDALIQIRESYESSQEEVEDTKDSIDDLNESIADQQKKIADLAEQIKEAEREQYEAYHGTETFQSGLDALINYTEKLDKLNDEFEKIKESLEDISDLTEANNIFGQLDNNFINQQTLLGAENKEIDDALKNLQTTLTQNYGDYIQFSGDTPTIDFSYMSLDANDELKKAFEEEYTTYQDYYQKRQDNLDKIAELDKMREEMLEDSLSKTASIQSDMMSILKEQASEEVDIQKEKYAALEEADNNYLDALEEAIQKQRDLRDLENSYDELATKRKKLSLMERDTSGSNQKEVQSLRDEIADDEQNLLDQEVDNLIDSMRELYEVQQEARNAELEHMEAMAENDQIFADTVSQIMSTWTSSDDALGWFLENDTSTEDMTVEQTESYINDKKEELAGYFQYLALSNQEYLTTTQEDVAEAVQLTYDNISANTAEVGTTIQETAEQTALELQQEADEALANLHDDMADAQKDLQDTQTEIAETQKKLQDAETAAQASHEAAMQAMITASKDGMSEVSAFAIATLADMTGVDLTNPEAANKFASEMGYLRGDKVSEGFKAAVEQAGGDVSNMQTYSNETPISTGASSAARSYKVTSGNKTVATFSNREQAEAYVKGQKNPSAYAVAEIQHGIENNGKIEEYGTFEAAQAALLKKKTQNPKDYMNAKAFKTGGLVDYTGPAWVDGTPTKPEAFLNASDTENLRKTMDIMDAFISSTGITEDNTTRTLSRISQNNSTANNSNIEINVQIDSIANDYDVDRAVERMRADIVNASKPVGSSVILKK